MITENALISWIRRKISVVNKHDHRWEGTVYLSNDVAKNMVLIRLQIYIIFPASNKKKK